MKARRCAISSACRVRRAATQHSDDLTSGRSAGELPLLELGHGLSEIGRPPGIVLDEYLVLQLRAGWQYFQDLLGHELERLRVGYRVVGELHVFRIGRRRVEQIVQVLEGLLLV